MVEKFTRQNFVKQNLGGRVKNLIPIAIIIAGILIAGAIVYINQGKSGILSPQAAAEKAIEYINQNMLQEGMSASFINAAEENGIYKFRFKIMDREFDSYVTKDGKILFIEGIDLEEKSVVQPEAPPAEEEPKEKLPIGAASLEAFAKCLNEKGAEFYGTYQCPWCLKQKEMFGEAAKYLPYIECSPDRATEAELAQCKKAGVGSIPDWRFPDGSQELGLQSLEKLAELSGCPL